MGDARELPEELFHGVWAVLHRYAEGLRTADGRSLTIRNPGLHNRDAGADFFNARIVVGDQLWAGDVELHINESDWYAHGHDKDPAYNAVILHVVVHRGDRRAVDSAGREVPTLVIPHAGALVRTYRSLIDHREDPCCGEALGELSPLEQSEWMMRLLVERLQAKSAAAEAEVAACELGWEEAFLRSLAQSLGQRVNADPMLWLMRATPFKALSKIRDGWLSLEALLLGQAGLIEAARREGRCDTYVETLGKEYYYQAVRFGLKPISGSVWKYLRIRPAAFPSLRIAQLAAIIYRSEHLFSKMLTVRSVSEVEQILRVPTSDYWLTHYTLGDAPSAERVKKIGRERAKIVLINSVVPYRFAYAASRGDAELRESTLDLLEQVSPEENAVVRRYAQLGLKVDSAQESQAIVQLLKQHCRPRLCYRCPIGLRMLTRQIRKQGGSQEAAG